VSIGKLLRGRRQSVMPSWAVQLGSYGDSVQPVPCGFVSRLSMNCPSRTQKSGDGSVVSPCHALFGFFAVFAGGTISTVICNAVTLAFASSVVACVRPLSPPRRTHVGFFCNIGTATACSQPEFFCPEGSTVPQPTSPGFYAVADSIQLYVNQSVCDAGSYCAAGIRWPCPAGRFGPTQGDTRPTCHDACLQGYFCRPGSSSPTEEECGDPSVVCPSVRA
jgi:hypothetical protein